MTRKRRLVTATVFALMLTVFVTTSAFAHYCVNPQKKAGAGSIGTITVILLPDGNIDLVSFEPGKKLNADDPFEASNGGFLTFTDGASWSYDIFLHPGLPLGALQSGPGGLDMCDGHGIDFVIACLGLTG
jgi:hypothetical protein